MMHEYIEKKPSGWLVLATGLIAPFAAYGVMIGASKLFWAFVSKHSDGWALQTLYFIATLYPIQFTFAIFVLLAVFFSGSNLRLRIRLVRPRIGIGTILLSVLSILFIHYLAFLLRRGIFPIPSGQLEYEELLFVKRPSGLVWFLVASGAVCFRFYAKRRCIEDLYSSD